jgi:hypothetical protein
MPADGHKSRRVALRLLAGAPALVITPGAALTARSASKPVDPVLALIADHKAAGYAHKHNPDESAAATEAGWDICVEKMEALCDTESMTLAGASALLAYLIEDEADHFEAVAPFVRASIPASRRLRKSASAATQ